MTTRRVGRFSYRIVKFQDVDCRDGRVYEKWTSCEVCSMQLNYAKVGDRLKQRLLFELCCPSFLHKSRQTGRRMTRCVGRFSKMALISHKVDLARAR